MKWLYQIRPIAPDLGFLMMRLAAAFMLFHGTPKLLGFTERMATFSDPIGIGPVPSLILCIFAEFFCTIFVVLGLFTRVMLIPLLINMSVIIFIVHSADPISDKESPITYLLLYLGLFFTGPGSYSIDGLRKA
ncbi:MAG: DoxX family protein [Bacteroidota bacterium]